MLSLSLQHRKDGSSTPVHTNSGARAETSSRGSAARAPLSLTLQHEGEGAWAATRPGPRREGRRELKPREERAWPFPEGPRKPSAVYSGEQHGRQGLGTLWVLGGKARSRMTGHTC